MDFSEYFEKTTRKGGRGRIKPPVTGGKAIPRTPSKTGQMRGRRRKYPR